MFERIKVIADAGLLYTIRYRFMYGDSPSLLCTGISCNTGNFTIDVLERKYRILQY